MVRVVSCRFLRLSCREDDHPLFRRYYARSNRERGVKLLRCFPHCCPEHVQRCYCGTSIHVQVTFAAVLSAASQENLVVCARFEPSRVVPLWPSHIAGTPGFEGEDEPNQENERKLQPGEVVALPASVLAVGKRQAKPSVWIRASREGEVKQKLLPKNEVLYVLNNHRFPKWLYSYDSSVTRTQREMTHHLVVYVFQPTGVRSQPGEINATVLARHESPAFSLISYRRSGNNSRDAGCDLPALDAASGSTFAAVDVDSPDIAASTPNGMEIDSLGLQNVDPMPGTSYESKSEGEAEYQRPYIRTQTGTSVHCRSDTDTCFWLYDAHARQSGLAEKTKHLVILWRFLSCISLSDVGVTHHILDEQISSHWRRAAGALRASPSSRTMQLEGVMNAFLLSLGRSTAPFPHDHLSPREQAVMQSATQLLLRALSSRAIQYALQSAFTVNSGRIDKQELRERFITLVLDVYHILGDLLQLGSNVAERIALPALVDEVLSVIYSQRRFTALRVEVSSLLMGHQTSNSQVETVDDLFRTFAAQIQEILFAASASQSVRQSGWASGTATSWSLWSRQWLLEPGSIHVASIPQEQSFPIEISLVELSRWIHEFACIEMEVQDNGSRLSVRSALPMVKGMAPTGLMLDGRLRGFRVTPSGITSMLPTSGGWSIGDYAGGFSKRTDTLEIDFYTYRARNLDESYGDRARRSYDRSKPSLDTVVQRVSMTFALEEHLNEGGSPSGVDPRDSFIFFRGVVAHAVYVDPLPQWNQQPKLTEMSTSDRSEVFRELQWAPQLDVQGGYVAVPP